LFNPLAHNRAVSTSDDSLCGEVREQVDLDSRNSLGRRVFSMALTAWEAKSRTERGAVTELACK